MSNTNPSEHAPTKENTLNVTEEDSRRVAEESRETDWVNPSFMKELFLGNFRFDLISPYPERTEWRPDFLTFFDTLKAFLRDEWDAVEVDHTGEYPEDKLKKLAEMGAFGMKIPPLSSSATSYLLVERFNLGVGFAQVSTCRVKS